MSYDKKSVIGWNEDYVKSVKKDEFVKAHLHLGDKEFLESVYNKIVKPEKEDKK